MIQNFENKKNVWEKNALIRVDIIAKKIVWRIIMLRAMRNKQAYVISECIFRSVQINQYFSHGYT